MRWCCAPRSIQGPPPAGFAPYRSTNLRMDPLHAGRGNTRAAKFGLLGHIVPWARATRRVARSVDAVHLRCPCNIGLVAIFSTWKAGCLRYAMYAGVWHDYDGEPRFFRLQRKLLATRWFGGPVSVYADRDPSRPHLEPFFSPSYSSKDMIAAEPGALAKVERIRNESLSGPWKLVTVGRLTENKNQQTVLRALPGIVAAGVDATLDVFGDGPCRPALEQLAMELGMDQRITFHGSVDHGDVMAAFAAADLNLLSTRQEGFGKVLLEGMVHAAVPVFGESPVAGISGAGSQGLSFRPTTRIDSQRRSSIWVADRTRWEAAMAEDAQDADQRVSRRSRSGCASCSRPSGECPWQRCTGAGCHDGRGSLDDQFHPSDAVLPPGTGCGPSRLGSIVAELVRQGHEVDVVTALPNYPLGRIFDGWSRRPLQRLHESGGGRSAGSGCWRRWAVASAGS